MMAAGLEDTVGYGGNCWS